MKLLIILLLTGVMYGQSTVNNNLPDAPQPPVRFPDARCGWSICEADILEMLCGQRIPRGSLVDWNGKKCIITNRFWTFRGVTTVNGRRRFDSNAPRLHPNKRSWIIYGVSHAAMFGAWAVANHQVETPGSELPAMGGVAGTLRFRA